MLTLAFKNRFSLIVSMKIEEFKTFDNFLRNDNF
jgi:hypothetical protein